MDNRHCKQSTIKRSLTQSHHKWNMKCGYIVSFLLIIMFPFCFVLPPIKRNTNHVNSFCNDFYFYFGDSTQIVKISNSFWNRMTPSNCRYVRVNQRMRFFKWIFFPWNIFETCHMAGCVTFRHRCALNNSVLRDVVFNTMAIIIVHDSEACDM